MIPVEALSAFFVASVLLGLAPGPDNIFVLTQSALHGRGAGLAVTLGLCTGLMVHTLAVVLGVAVIFQVSTVAFTALKFTGAAYLLYLGWQAFRAAATPLSAPDSLHPDRLKLYRRGILMNITNPKVSIFFLAFLPQFSDPARGSVSLQIALLGAFFIFATILVFGSIALLSGTLGGWLNRSTRIQSILNRVAGTVFIGLALALAVSHR